MQLNEINLKDLVDNVADTAVVILSNRQGNGEYSAAAATKGTITEVCTLIASLITTLANDYIDDMENPRPDELVRTESAIVTLITKSLRLNRVDGIREVKQ